MLLRRLRGSTRNRAATPLPPPTEAERLLRIYQETHADVRELLDEVAVTARRAA